MRSDVPEDDPRVLVTVLGEFGEFWALMGLSDDLCHQGPYRNSTCRTRKVNLPGVCNRDEVP